MRRATKSFFGVFFSPKWCKLNYCKFEVCDYLYLKQGEISLAACIDFVRDVTCGASIAEKRSAVWLEKKLRVEVTEQIVAF